MKRPLFILIGAVIIFLLMAVWVYVLFFTSTKEDPDAFANLDLGNTTDPTYVAENIPEEQPVVNVNSPQPLRQLTTKPTIGYQEVQPTASSSPVVFYIESGTGHIFSIDLTSGEEQRISATTIPASRVGAITPDGQFVMIQSGSGAGKKTFIGTVSTTSESLSVTPLNEYIVDFTATDDNTFLFAVQTNNSVVGKEYLPQENTSKTLFTTPFREAAVQWGETSKDTHYVYPKASSQLEGFLYEVLDGTLNRLPVDGFGLTAVGDGTGILYSKQFEGNYESFLYSEEQGANAAALNILPDKCTPLSRESGFLCGGAFTDFDSFTPDSWYQGVTSHQDSLWKIDASFGSAEFLSDMTKVSGRQIDVTNMQINRPDSRLYFTNKLDSTLWLFERTVSTSFTSTE